MLGIVLVEICVYADDEILIGSTVAGLQKNLDIFDKALSKFGLVVNNDKSRAMSMVLSGRQKKIKIIDRETFRVSGSLLKQIGVLDAWRYLGINFTGEHALQSKCGMVDDLERLTRAPLKPQQRINMLKKVVFPKYNYALVLLDEPLQQDLNQLII